MYQKQIKNFGDVRGFLNGTIVSDLISMLEKEVKENPGYNKYFFDIDHDYFAEIRLIGEREETEGELAQRGLTLMQYTDSLRQNKLSQLAMLKAKYGQ